MTNYEYDAVGNLKSVAYPNGFTAQYSYNNLNRLLKVFNHKSSGDTVSCYSYSLGPSGNRTKVVEHSGRIVEYTYDETYRLTEEKINDPVFGLRTIQYTYDPVGNRLFKVDNGDTTAYAYDFNNRLLTENDTEYVYDDNGNTIQKIAGVDTTAYQYDYQDRLVEANYDTVQVDYVYNIDGIRVQKTVADVDTIHYLIDDNRDFAQVLQERDNSGIVSASYTHGHDLICQHRDSSLTFYHYDGQMSVRNLTDEWQNTTDGYTFDAFGILLTQFGATQNNYLYTGEQFDPNVGFYYLRARYYNPEIGRFATVDPWKGSIYDPVSLHRYLYCGNRPLDFVDWSGKAAVGPPTNLTDVMGGINLSQHFNIMTHAAKRLLWKAFDTFMEGVFTAFFAEFAKQIKEGKVDVKDLFKAMHRGGMLAILARIFIKYELLRVALLVLYFGFVDITKDYPY